MNPNLQEFLTQQSSARPVALTVGRKGGPKQKVSLSLPVTIGSSSACDVIVNASSLPPLGKVVFADGERGIRVWDARLDALAPASSLRDLGIHVHQDSGRNRRRVISALVAAVGLGAFVTLSLRKEPVKPVVDGFARTIPLALGKLFPYYLDSSEADRTYAKGVQFAIPLASDEAQGRLRLSFMAQGLDEPAELRVLLNGQVIGELASHPKCAQDFCEFYFPIPTAAVTVGENRVSFVHTAWASDFALKDVLLEKVAPITPVERAVAQRQFDAASRAYDERAISPKNLLMADDELTKLKAFLATREGADELAAAARALQAEVAQELSRQRNEILFAAQKNVALGRVGEAVAAYRGLLQLYADPSSPVAMNVKDAIAALENIKP